MNKQVKLYLHSGKVNGAIVEFKISIGDPAEIKTLGYDNSIQETGRSPDSDDDNPVEI